MFSPLTTWKMAKRTAHQRLIFKVQKPVEVPTIVRPRSIHFWQNTWFLPRDTVPLKTIVLLLTATSNSRALFSVILISWLVTCQIFMDHCVHSWTDLFSYLVFNLSPPSLARIFTYKAQTLLYSSHAWLFLSKRLFRVCGGLFDGARLHLYLRRLGIHWGRGGGEGLRSWYYPVWRPQRPRGRHHVSGKRGRQCGLPSTGLTLYTRDYLTIWTPMHLWAFPQKRTTGEFSGIVCVCAFLPVLPTRGKTFRQVWRKIRPIFSKSL